MSKACTVFRGADLSEVPAGAVVKYGVMYSCFIFYSHLVYGEVWATACRSALWQLVLLCVIS